MLPSTWRTFWKALSSMPEHHIAEPQENGDVMYRSLSTGEALGWYRSNGTYEIESDLVID